MAIQMRRGNYNDFDPTRMMAGEFAVCLDNGYVYMTLSPGNVIQLGTADTIEEAVELAEAWAKGTKDGTPVSSSDPTYHNNAKYYSETSDNRAKDSEAYAIGKRNGSNVPSSDPAYQNNAKYYAERAAHAVEYTENTDASATKIGYQSVIVNGVSHIIDGTIYMQQTKQLVAYTDTDFIFTNNVITENSNVDIWVDNYGVSPTNAITTNGQCVITFNHKASIELTCKIYIR